ncbi:MAG: Crp/Fnr family transcriptional regulator [Proteobacteria bacterium]|nr:Crp/Fnr family transcriptional regulator [Pseudomonadota bacterium]MCP4921966.1 Crp/Fnr family transcriptional regulator [Pseudomonadota bacterium]
MDVNELRRLRGLRLVPEDQLETLAKLAGEPVPVEKGQLVLTPGDTTQPAMLLLSGRLQAEIGTEQRILGDIWPGEIFGESALFQKGRARVVGVRAVFDSTVVELHPRVLEAARGTEVMRTIQLNLLSVLAKRIQGTNHAMRQVWHDQHIPDPSPDAPPAGLPRHDETEKPSEMSLTDRLRKQFGGWFDVS